MLHVAAGKHGQEEMTTLEIPKQALSTLWRVQLSGPGQVATHGGAHGMHPQWLFYAIINCEVS
jgi:hypothetical protein